MRMLSLRPCVGFALMLALPVCPVRAQHAGHDASSTGLDSVNRFTMNITAQAIPLVTFAQPSAGGEPRAQVAFTQLLFMGRMKLWQDRAALDVALNGEGVTIPSGELNTGAYGEGFVDRRHPHVYVHELMLTGRGAIDRVAFSATAGRGFTPFGTDDPMMRPLVKYPINHHLSQILERATLIGAMRVGPVIVEGSTFGGDEPVRPTSFPRANRFGDSWSARATLLPMTSAELQASYARVASPEELGGHGLDQRKLSVSGRAASHEGGRYLLAEWARTVERDHDRNLDVFGFESALVEGSIRMRQLGVALRVEQTD